MISFYKERVKQISKDFFETSLNQIIGSDLSQDEKNQYIFTISNPKASSSVFVKDKELVYSNAFQKSILPYKSEYTLNDYLSALSTLNKKNTNISIKGIPVVSDLYKNIEKNYYILKVSVNVRISIDNDNEDENVILEPIDVYFKSTDEKGFFIYAIENEDNKNLLSGTQKITPTKDTEELPGAFIIFKVNPVTAKIFIDGTEFENVYGQKVRVEKGQHIVEVKTPNDKYEEIPPRSIYVPTDISTIEFEESLKLNKGQLSIYPASVCVTGAYIAIYKVKEIDESDNSKKKKKDDGEPNITKRNYKKHVDLKSEVVMNLPFEKLNFYPGNYIAIIHKDGYLPNIKLINFSVIPNTLVTRTIELKDDETGKVIVNNFANALSSALSQKGAQCTACYGSGKCKFCNGTGYKNCKCCNGAGSFADQGRNIKCNTCNGSGNTKCNNCGGKGRCKNCNGRGIM